MSDVAQILSVGAVSTTEGESSGPFKRRTAVAADELNAKPVKAKKKLSREVSALLNGQSDQTAAPIMPTKKIVIGGFKDKRGNKGRRWVWKKFTSGARKDNLQLSHWVQADAEFIDYPFARFDKRVEVIRYSDSEYNLLFTPSPEVLKQAETDKSLLLTNSDLLWSREATDTLFEMCRKYDLRWPVVYDRFVERRRDNQKDSKYTYESLKARFYYVTSRVLEHRRQGNSEPNEYELYKYHQHNEEQRRQQLEALFRRTPDQLATERAQLAELKAIEVQIRRIEASIIRSGKQEEKGKKLKEEAYSHVDEAVVQTAGLAIPNLATRKYTPYRFQEAVEATVNQTVATTGSRKAPPKETKAAGQVWNTNVFTAPVALRSQQLAAPIDGIRPDSAAWARSNHFIKSMPIAERPLPTALVLSELVALRRETIALIIQAQQVQTLEQEVYKLQQIVAEAAVGKSGEAVGHGVVKTLSEERNQL